MCLNIACDQHGLKDMPVQAQIGAEPLELAVPVLEFLHPLQLAKAKPAIDLQR